MINILKTIAMSVLLILALLCVTAIEFIAIALVTVTLKYLFLAIPVWIGAIIGTWWFVNSLIFYLYYD